MKIALVRHGTTEANVEERFLSRTDLPLNDAGRERARELASLLAFIEGPIFVSPMKRCIETAQLALPGRDMTIRDELREIDFGAWELLTVSQIESRFPGALAMRATGPVPFRPPGGESFEDVAERVRPLIRHIAAQPCVVVSHRGTLGVLERLLLDLPLDARGIRPLQPAETRLVESIV